MVEKYFLQDIEDFIAEEAPCVNNETDECARAYDIEYAKCLRKNYNDFKNMSKEELIKLQESNTEQFRRYGSSINNLSVTTITVKLLEELKSKEKICPYCHKCMDDKEAKNMILSLCKNAGGIREEIVNPSGRSLVFDFGEKNLKDYCYWCDYEDLEYFLYEKGKLL